MDAVQDGSATLNAQVFSLQPRLVLRGDVIGEGPLLDAGVARELRDRGEPLGRPQSDRGDKR